MSFYDYYQPESYLPQTDTYIEKDTEVNEKIERMRLEATAMLMSGEPTIIISTVSCIYSPVSRSFFMLTWSWMLIFSISSPNIDTLMTSSE